MSVVSGLLNKTKCPIDITGLCITASASKQTVNSLKATLLDLSRP